MDCVNHVGVSAAAYCQNCGKALCEGCARHAAGGQLYCAPCLAAWQGYQQPVAAPFPSGPNPSAAAVLGLIPGVGAMYNGQFLKGFIHVIVFAVLISITSAVNGLFGIFIGAWVLYQSFEAYHTATAMRDGEPLPDPFGLNEVGNWLNAGSRMHPPGQPGAGDPAANGSYPPHVSGAAPQMPYQGPFPGPFPPPYPPQGWSPSCFGRNVPVGAIVLIGLGVIFLLGQLNIFHGRLMEFAWPLVLIALGVWLIVRRIGESQGGSR